MSKKKKPKCNSPAIKKKKSKKPIVIILAVVLAVGIAITAFAVFNNVSKNSVGIYGKTFKSISAYDASGDEVKLQDVYNVLYSSYQGTAAFNDDGTFTFWMTPGSADDGTHKGTFTYNKDKDIINATFDNREKVKFTIKRNSDGSVKRIEVPYQGYTVYMS